MKNIKAYCIGSGIGSLAAAAFMIRDGRMNGSQITIFDKLPTHGGSTDGQRLEDGSYSLRGGRMLTTDHYESFWGLYEDIPSMTDPKKSVKQELIDFNKIYVANAKSRLINKHRHKVDVEKMGFNFHNRMELLRLTNASEEKLGTSKISDWLSDEFFETNFWYMWQTTFAFQTWHSAVEFKRYLHRFMNEFPRIETLGGVKRTVYNQYDSLILPLQKWLEDRGVTFMGSTDVTDLETDEIKGKVTVTSLSYTTGGKKETVKINPDDIVILQNGSMTDASSLGTMTTPPPHRTKTDSQGWALWEKLANKHKNFGNPKSFNSSIPESFWESFTVTCRTPDFFNKIIEFSGNEPGTGGLMTFKDSNWLMSIVLYHQPHFIDQPDDHQVFWGYALHGDKVGDFVPKPMIECSGEEILTELCGHFNFEKNVFENATCIPCRMPYITSMFMPRDYTDRPKPVPQNSKNLAMVSQFVEVKDDVVFTVEYSVRAAQMAVYELLKIDKKIPPITRHSKSAKVLLNSLVKSYN